MIENIKKFLEKAAQDPELTAKLSAVQNPDEAYELASSVQDGFTKEEFIAAMKELAAVNDDLSNADLKKFSGGGESEVLSLFNSYNVTGVASNSAWAAI